jgi:hypothetical protein
MPQGVEAIAEKVRDRWTKSICQRPVWKVCIARQISQARNFDAFYIFTIKFSKSPARNFQTFQSGSTALNQYIINNTYNVT